MSIFSEIKESKPESSEKSSFDPDKRVDASGKETKGDVGKTERFDPDKRVETKTETTKLINDYIKDIKKNSEVPQTLPEKPFSEAELEKVTPERNAELRDEFNEKKPELKKEWEQKKDMKWPKYDKDVYSSSGKLIRKAGSDYDAHHIHPLGMGGKNEASNITPLHVDVHYDHQGVHSFDSPYGKLDRRLESANN